MLSAMLVASSPRYAVLETKDLVETHRLVDHDRNDEVILAPVRGGMVTRFRLGNDEILFLDQATLRDHTQNVRGGIPVLFPVAGRLTDDEFVLDGERFSMPQHGFARKLAWRITATNADQAAAALTLSLENSDMTVAQWPFEFRLTFRYELCDGALTIQQKFENLSDRPMPVHPGLHPYFRVDEWRKRDVHLATAATRAFDNRTGALRTLTGPIDFGSGEVDLQLLDHGQTRIQVRRPDAPAIELEYDRAETVITVWTLPSHPFVCVEPWATRSDALNRGDPLWIAAGDAHQAFLRISLEPQSVSERTASGALGFDTAIAGS
jgi:galactose mutarotase-like enzyme